MPCYWESDFCQVGSCQPQQDTCQPQFKKQRSEPEPLFQFQCDNGCSIPLSCEAVYINCQARRQMQCQQIQKQKQMENDRRECEKQKQKQKPDPEVNPDTISNPSGSGQLVIDILGCTDPNADNYNPKANKNDGSCIVTIGSGDSGIIERPSNGCTDLSAINFNPDATVDDGSCMYNGDQPLPPGPGQGSGGVSGDGFADAPNTGGLCTWDNELGVSVCPGDLTDTNTDNDFYQVCKWDTATNKIQCSAGAPPSKGVYNGPSNFFGYEGPQTYSGVGVEKCVFETGQKGTLPVCRYTYTPGRSGECPAGYDVYGDRGYICEMRGKAECPKSNVGTFAPGTFANEVMSGLGWPAFPSVDAVICDSTKEEILDDIDIALRLIDKFVGNPFIDPWTSVDEFASMVRGAVLMGRGRFKDAFKVLYSEDIMRVFLKVLNKPPDFIIDDTFLNDLDAKDPEWKKDNVLDPLLDALDLLGAASLAMPPQAGLIITLTQICIKVGMKYWDQALFSLVTLGLFDKLKSIKPLNKVMDKIGDRLKALDAQYPDVKKAVVAVAGPAYALYLNQTDR
jgi:hypothetical protein